MKRTAEKQLTQDDHDDDIEETSGPGSGFLKADESVLSSRPMRSLPKRKTPLSNGITSTEAPKQGFVGFGLATPPTSSTNLGTPPPSLAPSASNAAKTFTSFLTGSSSNPVDSASSSSDSAAVDYYKSLRGLNISLQSTLSKAVDEDPFSDLSELLSRYKEFRLDIETKYKSSKSGSTSSTSTLAPSKAERPPAAMPSAPTSFSIFGGATTPASTTPATNGAGGFTPSLAKTSTTAAPFSFGSSAAASTSSTAASTSNKPFSFSDPTATSSSNSSSPFGDNSKVTSAPKPFSFGDMPSSNQSIEGSTTPKAGTFGSFGGFGKASNSSNVGFSFGSPSPLPTPDESKANSEFSFSGQASDRGMTPATEGDGESTAADASREETPTIFGSNPNDEEGEGEEDEETIHSVKSKAFQLKDKKWENLGTGFLRIKRHQETKKSRLLMRNSSNGKVNINFNLYKDISPKLDGKKFTLVGHHNGVQQTYAIQVANGAQAQELVDRILEEASKL